MATSAFSFNDESTADIILRASDGQSFYVHTAILSAHSGIFADAGSFSGKLESASSSVHADNTNVVSSTKELEAVECSESSQTLGTLLRFMYRHEARPDLQSMKMAELSALADAVEKYDVFAVKHMLWMCMSERSEADPLHVFRYASFHGYKQMAVEAVIRVASDPGKLEAISATAKINLPDFALEQWNAMQRVILATNTLKEDFPRGSNNGEVAHTRSGFGPYECTLWTDHLYKGILNPAMASTVYPFIRAYDFNAAIAHAIKHPLNSCVKCQSSARTWLAEYMQRKKARLQAIYGETSMG